MPSISIQAHEVQYTLRDKRKIYDWIRRVVKREGKKDGEIAVILCSDEFLLQMNNDFLQHDYYTDIITFDYSEGKTVSGELYISIDRVKDNAIKTWNSTLDELHRVIIHGVLHLCGYGDKTKKEQEIMRNKENSALKIRRF
jgi:rRNA maturation RNase YbeY